LNELAKQVPEGIFLRSMKQQGNTVTLQGVTQSNARVSALMRNIDASPWMERPVLMEIKTGNLDKRRVSEFTMTFVLTRVATTDATGGKK
jgi:type IV pilus assembly protein PilN